MAYFAYEVDLPRLKFKGSNGIVRSISLFDAGIKGTDTESDLGILAYLPYRTQPDLSSKVYKDYYIPLVAPSNDRASAIHVIKGGTEYAMRLTGYSVGVKNTVLDVTNRYGTSAVEFDITSLYTRNLDQTDSYNLKLYATSRIFAILELQYYNGGKWTTVLPDGSEVHGGKNNYSDSVCTVWPWNPDDIVDVTMSLQAGHYRLVYGCGTAFGIPLGPMLSCKLETWT